MKKKIIAVIGNKKIEPDGIRYRLAFETGKILVDHGYRIQSGGMGGVMEAVFAGAHASENYREGDTVALVPSFDSATANAYAVFPFAKSARVWSRSLKSAIRLST